MPRPHVSRRGLLTAGGAAMLASPFFTTKGLLAEELMATPRLTEGPFYPDRLPLDQDNDLILIGDNTTPAVGEITNFNGRILTLAGSPVRNATVEIWQCDANAVYLHSRDSDSKKTQQDSNFQGYGKFETASDGGYRFRTIKPVPYPGRPAPHIHIKVSQNGHEVLTTQCMIRGNEGNSTDGVFRRLSDPAEQKLIMADWNRIPNSKINEWTANFDIVLGRTPDDRPTQGS
ncbi:dioxygenase family protein [Neorhodopirellula pilleata]|uniref:Protocatechuate 3,4-dioxygenase beta chain n=1 Tax=Neorhodopirellula pilleata TaxID=2714738 RepID=A0A5C6AEB7_9BACT|nr:protocatechuate 3,4-dioxygenase [Neorhodopirellula pilleata]TWT96573.1 Protocatechuate 3,4-dioxygenase beta chain [Neorhodopirellula pilleata]